VFAVLSLGIRPTTHPKADHDNAAAAKNVHRHLLSEVSIAFDAVSGAAMVDARGLQVLNLHARVVLRFKKMDEEGHSVSYPTDQARLKQCVNAIC